MSIKSAIVDFFSIDPKPVEKPAEPRESLYPDDIDYPQQFSSDEVELALSQAAGGDIGTLWKLYERMEYTDPYLGGLVSHLFAAVAQQPIRRVYREESYKAQRYEAKLQKTFDLLDLRHFISIAVRAHTQGAAIIRMKWDVYERDGAVHAYPTNIQHVPLSSVKMIVDQFSDHYGELGIMTDKGDIIPVSKLDPRFYMLVKSGDHDGKWDKVGAMRKIVPWWATKQFAHKRWLNYVDVYGVPLRVGYLPAGATPKAAEELKKALRNLRAFAWAIVRSGSEIDLKEANHPPTVDVYRSLIDYAHKQYAVALIGTPDVVGDNREGSYARLKISNSIRYEFVRTVSAIVEDALTQLAARIIAVNMKSDFDPLHLPKVKLRVMPPTDQLELANVMKVLSELIDIPEDYIREMFNIPEVKPDGGSTVS